MQICTNINQKDTKKDTKRHKPLIYKGLITTHYNKLTFLQRVQFGLFLSYLHN